MIISHNLIVFNQRINFLPISSTIWLRLTLKDGTSSASPSDDSAMLERTQIGVQSTPIILLACVEWDYHLPTTACEKT